MTKKPSPFSWTTPLSQAVMPPGESKSRRQALVRPEGWSAPGPRPRGSNGRPHLLPGEGEELCALSGDFHLLQLRRGHRWSIDDLLTAWLAIDWFDRHGNAERGPVVREPHDLPPCEVDDVVDHVDLGCGIGSVLLMLAWAYPKARCVGIEAQPKSVSLARRSIEWNGVEDRVAIKEGDLRELASRQLVEECTRGGGFALVTGTPPYFDVREGLVSETPQRGPCRFELRGGIEEYALAAERILAPRGVFVVCSTMLDPSRTQRALQCAGLEENSSLMVIPKEGRPPLFSVHVATRPSVASVRERRTLTIRDAHGKRTKEASAVRSRLGMPW